LAAGGIDSLGQPVPSSPPHLAIVNTAALPPPRESRTGPALWLLATQALALLSLAAWLLIAGFSFVAGPAHGDGALMPRPLLYLLWLYPLLPLACTLAAWRAFRRGDVRRAVRWTTLPLAVAIPLLAYAWYMASPVG
jgi:hypothetical protein